MEALADAGSYAGDAYGVSARATGSAGQRFALYGSANASAGTATAYGIYAQAAGAATNWAGYFNGNVHVLGTLSKTAGAFTIDHPLDPENKYLSHSFVESPDMKNIYDGTVTTDQHGEAMVALPDWFEALNRDFRYQLTVIGQFAQAIVADEINENQFTVKTDKPGVKVSWQVTGIRKDQYAEDHRIRIEEDKVPAERGKCLYPPLCGGVPLDAGAPSSGERERALKSGGRPGGR